MKKSSRILSLLLAVLLISSLCVPALAEEDPYAVLKEGTGYLAFGDSITRGYGASPLWDDEGYTIDNISNPNCRRVTGSYPLLVAEALGLPAPNDMTDKTAQYWPIAQDALTTSFIIDLLGLEDNFFDSEYMIPQMGMTGRYNADLYYFGSPESKTVDGTGTYGQYGCAISARQLVADSSLITIGIGMSDIFNRARSLATMGVNLSAVMSDTEALVSVLTDFVEKMYEGYDRWRETYPLILDFFKEKNPDAIVILIGAINPIFGMDITADLPVPVGTALSTITMLMNKQYKEWADEYGFVFLDISNVETGTTTYGANIIDFLSDNNRAQGIATHPTPEGYAQIARMIVAAVDKELAIEPAVPATFIKLDVGRFESVDSVVLDGDLVKNFTVEDHVITIPCYTTTANTLAISVVKEDGTVTVMTYSLEFENGAYTAHRTYVTNDAVGVFKTIINKIVQLVKDLFSKVFGALK